MQANLTIASPVDTSTAIRPFRINVPKDALEDMKRRVPATRRPRCETVLDNSQGSGEAP